MNEPTDPINVRQARQGKPVLVILAVSLFLAVIAGWVLWGAVAEDVDPAMETSSISQQLSAASPVPA
jgi:hypothetical protein